MGTDGWQAGKGFSEREGEFILFNDARKTKKNNSVSPNIHNFASKVSLLFFRWRNFGRP